MREIVFDTETTGLSPLAGDRVVEIGCVELVNRVETGRTYHCYFNPGRAMPSDAEAVHGLSAAFLSDKPRFEHKVDEFLAFIGTAPMVAHSAAFDFGFINSELSLCKRPPVCLSRMVCTLSIARGRHPGAKHSLDALCTRFGVDRSIRVKHGALVDAQLLAQVYVELTGGRQIGLSLGAAARDPASRAARANASPQRYAPRPPRPHAASEAERARHAVFLRTLTDPLWHRVAVDAASSRH